LYVNPTPSGTHLLLVTVDGQAAIGPRGRFLDVKGMDILMMLMAGREADAESAPGHRSYLFGVGGETELTHDEFRASIDGVLPWLGERLARPIHDLLAEIRAQGVTLILCGPLAAAPLHAAPWQDDDGQPRCLLDAVDVRFAPSAALAAEARRRAHKETQGAPTLVALGDPTGDLPAAGPEVEEIAHRFGQADIALGPDATSAFLRDHGPDADYLHFAGHARGGLYDRTDAAILLADGAVSALDLTDLASLDTRLVVVSACQSGLSEIVGMPEEALSIGTAMVAAGTACAIVSLWPVDDAATALLMVRLYDELIDNRLRPPEALRHAQCWLRDLTLDDQATFLTEHPLLEAELRRRALRGDLPGACPGPDRSAPFRLFSHPETWAAFIAVGA
jgi:CHAT domain-containing protein